MTRRNAGEGMIRQRPHGLWEARYVATDGRKRSIYAKTKREVSDRLRDALRDADTGLRPLDRRLTTGNYLNDWLAHHVKPNVRPRTAESYSFVVSAYLQPALGAVPLAQLQPEHVQTLLRGLAKQRRTVHVKGGERKATDKPLSATTVRYVYVVLRIALGRALKLGKVHRNVATLIDPPGKARREVQPISADQARALLAAVTDDPLEALYRVAIATGLRQGELLALRWSDVDLTDGAITVRHTLAQRTHELGEPKTDHARRVVAMDEDTIESLRKHGVRQASERIAAGARWKGKDREHDFVFATSIGTPMDHRNVVRAYHDVLDRAGIERRPFHQLRHACATLLLESGEELANVSKLLGHSSLATTADFYGHLTPRISRRAADRMRDILAG